MLGFSALSMLGLFPVVIGGLWYAYKRMGQAQRVLVGTSFYLKKLAGTSSSRKRFMPPWRFLVELAALLLLVLAAAGVFYKSSTKRVLVVFDDSRSMGAQINGEAVIDIAEARALSDLADAGSSVDSSLILTSAAEALIGESDISRAIKNAAPVDVEDGIERVVAREVGNFDEIWVYTDKELEAPLNVRVPALFPRDKAPANVGILSIVEAAGNLRANIFRVGAGAETVKISARKLVGGVYQEPYYSKSFKIIDSAEVDFGRMPDSPVEVFLTVPVGGNSISADDRAWILPKNSKTFKVYGEVDQVKIDGFRFVSANTEAILNEVFYKVDGTASGNALYVLPPSMLSAAAIGKGVPSKWMSESPLLKYLFSADFSDIPYLPLSLPEGASVVAASAAGPMIAAVSGDKRAVYVGIDLLPFDSKNVAKSILTLNILNWLSEERALRNGAILKDSRKFRSLSGAAQDFPINAGLWLAQGSSETLEAVNLFSASESQVGVKGALQGTPRQLTTNGGIKLWRYIVYLVLCLAVLDLLFSFVRRRRA